MLRRLQALVRVQHRARAGRGLTTDSPNHDQENPRSYDIHQSDKLVDSPVIKKCGSVTRNREARSSETKDSGTYWVDNWVEAESSVNSRCSIKNPRADEKNDKILEVDSWKPHTKPRKSRNRSAQLPTMQHISVQDYHNRSFAASDHLARYCPNDLCKPNASPSVDDVASLKSLHFPLDSFTADSGTPEATLSSAPRGFGSSRRSPKTPLRHEFSSRRSLWNGGYGSFGSPSYMANTESSRAKNRSQSVPRERGDSPDEKQRSIKRSLHAFWQSKTSFRKNTDPFANL